MNDGHRSPSQQTKGDEPLLAVSEPVVLEREREAIEHQRSIDEVEPVSLQVRGTFGLRPGELHDQLYIQIVMRSRSLCSGLTPEVTGASPRSGWATG